MPGHHGPPRVCVSVAPKQTRTRCQRPTPRGRVRPAMTHATRDAHAAFAPRPRAAALEYLSFRPFNISRLHLHPTTCPRLASLLPRSIDSLGPPLPSSSPVVPVRRRGRRAIPPDLIRHESRVVRPPIILPFSSEPITVIYSVGFSLVAGGLWLRGSVWNLRGSDQARAGGSH